MPPPRWLSRLGRPALGVEERLLMHRLERYVVAVGESCHPRLLHAHSPYRSALPAIAAGRRLGRPLVYEVRGLWEESAVATGIFRRDSAAYRGWRRQESRAMRAADAVVVLGQEMRREVVRRGAAEDRVFVVPNGIDSDWLSQPLAGAEPAAVSRLRHRFQGAFTFGYVGSLRRLEGVDDLLRATARLRRDGLPAAVVVLGEGAQAERLRHLAEDLELGQYAVFAGGVARHEVRHWYRLLQAVVVPRQDSSVARTVTPLKPLEPMASGLPVIASDLPALAEIVQHEQTGLLYPVDDPEGLAAACRRLMADPGLGPRLGGEGRRWVSANRTWDRLLSYLHEAYAAAEVANREHRRAEPKEAG